ncbi:nuclear transport factor 2 family protein [Actinomycetospora sp. C-140]
MTSTGLAEHPNVTHTRDAFLAAQQGDVGPFDAMLPDDFVMVNHDNGAADQAEIVGKDAFFGFYGRWLTFFEGTFAQEPLGIYGDAERVVMLVHETGRRGDAVFDNHAVYVITMRDGQWARLETYDRDREANERFWAAVGGPAALHAAG